MTGDGYWQDFIDTVATNDSALMSASLLGSDQFWVQGKPSTDKWIDKPEGMNQMD